MGFLRYGSYYDKNQRKYDRIKSIKSKIDMFEQTGNGEALVDIANQCMIIFSKKEHPTYYWHALDDEGHQTE